MFSLFFLLLLQALSGCQADIVAADGACTQAFVVAAMCYVTADVGVVIAIIGGGSVTVIVAGYAAVNAGVDVAHSDTVVVAGSVLLISLLWLPMLQLLLRLLVL